MACGNRPGVNLWMGSPTHAACGRGGALPSVRWRASGFIRPISFPGRSCSSGLAGRVLPGAVTTAGRVLVDGLGQGPARTARWLTAVDARARAGSLPLA